MADWLKTGLTIPEGTAGVGVAPQDFSSTSTCFPRMKSRTPKLSNTGRSVSVIFLGMFTSWHSLNEINEQTFVCVPVLQLKSLHTGKDIPPSCSVAVTLHRSNIFIRTNQDKRLLINTNAPSWKQQMWPHNTDEARSDTMLELQHNPSTTQTAQLLNLGNFFK